MTERARRLRKNSTDAENKLWYAIRRRQIGGLNFRRQHPIGSYVVDFYRPAIGLAIEVDGGQHNDAVARGHDDRRARWLSTRGVTLIRFWNNDDLSNLDGVLREIVRTAEILRPLRMTPSLTVPLSGGGKKTGVR